MTNQERWELYEDGLFRQTIAIELLDWAGYWTTRGVDEIEDATLKQQTKRAIEIITTDLGYAIGIVVSLAISDSSIKGANLEDVTEQLVSGVVTSIMTYKIAWVTGIMHVNE